MMSCVIFNSPAAGPTRLGATAQEEKRSPARTTAGNPNVRSFTVTIPGVAKGKRLKAARRELCRIIRHLGSAMRHGTCCVNEWSERGKRHRTRRDWESRGWTATQLGMQVGSTWRKHRVVRVIMGKPERARERERKSQSFRS